MANSTKGKYLTRNEAIVVAVLVLALLAVLTASVIYGPVFNWGEQADKVGNMLHHEVG